MAIERQNFRCGVILDYDNLDIYESRVEELGHINPSLEFWLFNNAPDIDNALVVGAGFGLATGNILPAVTVLAAPAFLAKGLLDPKKVDNFIRIIYQYITSRTPLSGKFVIAKG